MVEQLQNSQQKVHFSVYFLMITRKAAFVTEFAFKNMIPISHLIPKVLDFATLNILFTFVLYAGISH